MSLGGGGVIVFWGVGVFLGVGVFWGDFWGNFVFCAIWDGVLRYLILLNILQHYIKLSTTLY